MKRDTLNILAGARTAVLVAFAALAAMRTLPTASAQTLATSVRAARESEIGSATHALLALQRSNAAAAPAQPMLGAEAGLAYERYLSSFKSRIPATYASPVESTGGLLNDYKNGGGHSSDMPN
jgi:hypothetical protein